MMTHNESRLNKYDEFAYVLDYLSSGSSQTIKGRKGVVIQSIGEDNLNLLELLGDPSAEFDIGERLSIGKQERSKIISVLGKLEYHDLTDNSVDDLLEVIQNIVAKNETKYIDYLNNVQAVTPRLHGIELIPGVGKKSLFHLLRARERTPFTSFDDLQIRGGLKEPSLQIAKRIIEELSGSSKINLFVK